MLFVVDTSALATHLVSPPATIPMLSARDADAHAPHLIDAEVLSVLRRLNLQHRLSDVGARTSLDTLSLLPITRYAHGPILSTAWGFRHTVSAYDALFVALACKLEIPLLTADRRLARAASAFCDVIAA